MKVKIMKLRESAIVPRKATIGSAGYDLSACIDSDIVVNRGEVFKIPCGISIELPSNEYGAFIFARSGLSMKQGITLVNGVGVIDSDYRGEICVSLCKIFGDDSYRIKNGDRIAQMVFMKIGEANFDLVDDLEGSDRGSGGFGSTGK